MIQRIQSLFLLAAVILSGLMLTGNLMEMKDAFDNVYSLDFSSVTVDLSGNKQVQNIWPAAIAFICVPAFCFISIFLYKNRRLQMMVTMISLLMSLASLFIAAFFLIMLDRKVDLTFIWNIKAAIPVITAILCWLAYRAIQKDEEKVRSLDRLR